MLFATTYGFTSILVFINTKFGEANDFTIFMGLWCIVLNSIMVFLPSKIHSESKRLVVLMRRLVVASTDFADLRVRHLRALIVKQLEETCLNGGGGFALQMFGISLTYGFVIRLALWSATMIMISFKP